MNERILVIDDDLAVRKSFALTLADAGRQVDTAESGEASLDKAAVNEYDLIFLDIIENPELAERDEIVATPTLVKVSAEPVRMIIGDWVDKQSILSALGLTAKCREVIK